MNELAKQIFEQSKQKNTKTKFKGVDVVIKSLTFRDETRLGLLIQKGEIERFSFLRLCLCVFFPDGKTPVFTEEMFEDFRNSCSDIEWLNIGEIITSGGQATNILEDVTEASKN